MVSAFELQRLDVIKSALISIAMHELCISLPVSMGYLELLLGGNASPLLVAAVTTERATQLHATSLCLSL
jgi:hypothetical protein